MKLSKLVYEVVKSVSFNDDTNFTYDGFIRGQYDNDFQYAVAINNAFTPISTAIHRLSDRGKIKNKIHIIRPQPRSQLLDISEIKDKIKKIVSVFHIKSDGDYQKVDYREIGDGLLLVITFSQGHYYYIEYEEDIPRFSHNDYYYRDLEEGAIESKDIELKHYGISETMTDYIISYCKGMLLEEVAPEIANMHLTRAEQYFADLEPQQTSFLQNRVEKRYKIG